MLLNMSYLYIYETVRRSSFWFAFFALQNDGLSTECELTDLQGVHTGDLKVLSAIGVILYWPIEEAPPPIKVGDY